MLSQVGLIRSGVAAVPPWPRGTEQGPQYHLHHIRAPEVAPPSPPCLRSTTAVQSRLETLQRSRCGSTAVTCVTGMRKLLKITGSVTTVMAVVIENRSGTAPPVWRGIKPPCNREKVDWRPYGDPWRSYCGKQVWRVGENYEKLLAVSLRCGGVQQKP